MFLNKKGASSGIPREIYIFGIILAEILFGLLYLGMGNTMYIMDHDCAGTSLKAECLPDTTTNTYTNPLVNDETNTLLSYIITGIQGAPAWLNIAFLFLQALLIFLIVIVVLHG